MTAQPDELDDRARELEAERARPMARWNAAPPPVQPVHAVPATTRTAVLIEDVEHLAGTDDPDRIAKRLGYSSAKYLARRLCTVGRPDLARLFDRPVTS